MMHRWLVCALCAGLLVLPEPVAAACGWSFVPHVDGHNYVMSGVAKVSATDAWAVGERDHGCCPNSTTLTERWNGARWTLMPSPNPSGPRGGSRLTAVAVVAANDVWAVGSTGTGSGGPPPNVTLIEHWNGVRWTIVRSPNVSNQSFLVGVAAVSTNDVWAIGYNLPNGGISKLLEHWDGTRWKVASSPSACCLAGIAAVSAHDVWAVGGGGSCPNNNSCTLAEHWNGVRWAIEKTQNPNFNNTLFAVAGITASDVWSVGSQGDTATEVVDLAEHWNGTSWNVVPTPIFLSFGLDALAAISTSDVWAVGGSFDSQRDYTLTEHWNGQTWAVVPSPNASQHDGLSGVAALSSTDILAVGTAQDATGQTFHALTLRYHCSGR
jgi:hypothetical protein